MRLTGDTREHALFFAYGTGANGKSVLLVHGRGDSGRLSSVGADRDFHG